MSNTVSQNQMHQIEKIDRSFEYVLLLVGVLVAGIFEFGVYLASEGIIEKQAPIFLFRALFSSMALLVLLWLCSVSIKKTTFRIWLRLTTWAFGILILRMILVAFISWGFLSPPSARVIGVFHLVSGTSSFATVLVLFLILKSYMVPLRTVSFFRSKRWGLLLGVGWGFGGAINYGLVVVSVVGFKVDLTYVIFTSLLPMAIGLFFTPIAFLWLIMRIYR